MINVVDRENKTILTLESHKERTNMDAKKNQQVSFEVVAVKVRAYMDTVAKQEVALGNSITAIAKAIVKFADAQKTTKAGKGAARAEAIKNAVELTEKSVRPLKPSTLFEAVRFQLPENIAIFAEKKLPENASIRDKREALAGKSTTGAGRKSEGKAKAQTYAPKAPEVKPETKPETVKPETEKELLKKISLAPSEYADMIIEQITGKSEAEQVEFVKQISHKLRVHLETTFSRKAIA